MCIDTPRLFCGCVPPSAIEGSAAARGHSAVVRCAVADGLTRTSLTRLEHDVERAHRTDSTARKRAAFATPVYDVAQTVPSKTALITAMPPMSGSA